MASARTPLKLAVAGLGAIGLAVARRVDAGELPGIHLVAAAARDHDKARKATAQFRAPPPLAPLAALAEVADVILECLPAAHFAAVAEPALGNGRILMPLSVGALLDHWDLVARAEATGARILVPTGALLGLDAVRAAAEGTINSVRMVTRKPPAGLVGAPVLAPGASRQAALPIRSRGSTARSSDAPRSSASSPNTMPSLAWSVRSCWSRTTNGLSRERDT